MIDKKKFIEYMKAIKHTMDKEDKVNNFIRNLGHEKEGYAFIYSDEVTTMIKMICDLVDIGYNCDDTFGDDIQYFIYDWEWGRNKNCYIEEADGTKIILHNASELYDYIVKNAEEEN